MSLMHAQPLEIKLYSLENISAKVRYLPLRKVCRDSSFFKIQS